MPELPEVQTITADLKKYFENALIKDVKIASGYSTLPANKVFLNKAINSTIIRIFRVAKNIGFELDNGHFIVIHLAMTGRVLVKTPKDKAEQWEKVVFTLEKNDKQVHIRFSDVRMFGKVTLLQKEDITLLLNKYGPEPIAETTTAEQFFTQIKSKKTNIKNALLDQSIIAGLGNIYATDALFLAKINPFTATTDITPKMAKTLLETSRAILLEGIEHRGSTLDDEMYVDIFGKPGNHQKYFRIYGKDICPVCKSKTVFTKLNGRGTYYCPICQPLPADSAQKKLL